MIEELVSSGEVYKVKECRTFGFYAAPHVIQCGSRPDCFATHHQSQSLKVSPDFDNMFDPVRR
jgi:hypothetical protein